jgi:hypothetical protein
MPGLRNNIPLQINGFMDCDGGPDIPDFLHCGGIHGFVTAEGMRVK